MRQVGGGPAVLHVFGEKIKTPKTQGRAAPHKEKPARETFTDEELAAQADFIQECRNPHKRKTREQIMHQMLAERYETDYPVEWEKLPPDEFQRKVKKWREG